MTFSITSQGSSQQPAALVAGRVEVPALGPCAAPLEYLQIFIVATLSSSAQLPYSDRGQVDPAPWWLTWTLWTLELATNRREVFTITEKAPTPLLLIERGKSLLALPHLRHYAKQAPIL